jgi:apolipoprotein N-acyltransferase
VKNINLFNLKNNELFWLAVSAAAFACSFESINIDIFIWFAFFPFFFIIEKKSLKEAFHSGFFVGIIFYLLTIYWLIYTVSHFGKINVILSFFIFLLLVMYLALFFGIFALLHNYTKKRFDSVLLAPIIWVTLEYLRAHFLTGFPWILLGYSLYKRPVLTQFSDITGVYGQSFLIVLINSAVYRVYLYIKGERLKKYLVEAAASIIILIAAVIYGVNALDGDIINNEEVVRVGLTQGNIPQDMKWDDGYKRTTMDIYIGLTRDAAKELEAEYAESAGGKDEPKMPVPRLIVWPETAAPFYMQTETKLRSEMLALAGDTGSYILAGSLAFDFVTDDPDDKDYLLFNSAFLMSPRETILGRYDKVHLVPFGEYVPLHKILFFVNKLTEGVGDFSSGETAKNLVMNDYGYKFGVLICYESIFPNLVREFVDGGGDFLVNITNDAWFGNTSAPHQQLSMAAFRAVENKRYLIRSGNTGVSGIIDPFGRVLKKTAVFTKAFVTGEIRTVNKKTFYTKHGNIFAKIISLAFLILLLLSYRSRREQAQPA